MDRFLRLAAFVLPLLLTLAMAALLACENGTTATDSTDDGAVERSNGQLPTYAQREADGAVRVDLEAASDGSAKWTGEARIDLSFNDGNVAFRPLALSYASGLGASLEDPPLKISPVLSPGDGVSDVSAAVWMEGDPAELHVEVFIDTDWQDGVGEDIFIHSAALPSVDGEPAYSRIPIDFSESIQGVYSRELVFVGAAEWLGLGPAVNLVITNIDGETRDVLRAISVHEIEEGDVAVMFQDSRY